MLRVLIIEPHGDDALCSCSSVLRSGNEVDILTLSERPSDGLKNHYDSIKNVTFLDLKDLSFYDRPKVTTHEIHKEFKDGTNVYEYYKALVVDKFGLSYDISVQHIVTSLEGYLIRNNYDIVLAPLGLVHPYHLAVHDAACKSMGYSALMLYVDKPYYQYRYAKEMCESYKTSWIKTHTTGPSDKEDEIKRVLKDVYPTEVSMLRFSSDILLNHPDIFLYGFTVSSYDKIEKFRGSLE